MPAHTYPTHMVRTNKTALHVLALRTLFPRPSVSIFYFSAHYAMNCGEVPHHHHPYYQPIVRLLYSRAARSNRPAQVIKISAHKRRLQLHVALQQAMGSVKLGKLNVLPRIHTSVFGDSDRQCVAERWRGHILQQCETRF